MCGRPPALLTLLYDQSLRLIDHLPGTIIGLQRVHHV